MDKRYNLSSPPDTIKVREIPSAIREKGEEIISYINNLENSRITNSFSDINELIKFLYLTNNSEIGSGIYIKDINNSYWLGIANIKEIPTDLELKNNIRITLNNNSYRLKEIDNQFIWSLDNEFKPFLYYDLFKNGNNIENDGIADSGYYLYLDGYERINDILPFIKSNNIFKCRVINSYNFNKSFSFSVLFNNISRTYSNGNIIDKDTLSILMFIKDKFDIVRYGIAYDKDNHLFLINKDEKIDLDFIISENSYYQICLSYNNDVLSVFIDSNLIYSQEINIFNDKELFFSVCEDNDYGHYSNGSAIFGEINVFNIPITKEENLILKEHPRSWNINSYKDCYLDLTFEEKIKLKEFVKNIELQ